MAADLSGYWWIDGVDLWQAYNVALSEGSANLLRLPPKKEGIAHNWSDTHGRDYDLTNIYLDERVSQLKFYIMDVPESEFFDKRDAFLAQITSPGLHRLSLRAHGARNYYFFYKEYNSHQQNIALAGIPDNVVIHTFTITIVEPNPAGDGNPSQFIIEEEGRFLIS